MKKHCKCPAKRIFAVLLAVLTAASLLCVTASAETAGDTCQLYETEMTITVPEGATMLSMSTKFDDPLWQELNILSPYDKATDMIDNGIAAEIYGAKSGAIITVTAKETEMSKSIYNLNLLTDEELEEFRVGLIPQTTDGKTSGTAEWYEHAQIPFFCVDIQSDSLEENTVYERIYGTILNGEIISFDLYNGTEPVDEETDAMLRALIDSAEIAAFYENPGFQLEPAQLMTMAVLGLLFVLFVVFILANIIVGRKQKKDKKIMAEKLAAYREKKVGREDEGDGDLRFVNETVHSNEAIQKFGKYQAYHRNLFMPVFTVLLAVVAIVLVTSAGISDNWWMIVALVGFAAFSVYRSLTAGTTISKTLERVYGSMRSRKATYYFYDGDFRITGLQASSLHPYFQITEVAETKEYFYLYFGDNTTYFLKKDNFKGFENGKGADEFRAFLREKIIEQSK